MKTLHKLFSRKDGGTVVEAAEEMNCSQRTVFRRMAAMRESGYQLHQIRHGVWRSIAPETVPMKKPKPKASRGKVKKRARRVATK